MKNTSYYHFKWDRRYKVFPFKFAGIPEFTLLMWGHTQKNVEAKTM